jgi:hypothetical protein
MVCIVIFELFMFRDPRPEAEEAAAATEVEDRDPLNGANL